MTGSQTTAAGNSSGSPFVGRGPELAALRETLASALDGQGRIVLLTGEPGIGKTRTVEEILDGALENDESVLEGAVRETGEETGLEIVAERVVYVQEIVHRLSPPGALERPIRQVELYVLAAGYQGEIAITDPDVLDASFLSRNEVASVAAYPPMLSELFWRDLEDGFPELRFLGTHYIG
ncbi:hypothetical protein BH23CHL2_BH23CHL2_22490 [soil metagenome]